MTLRDKPLNRREALRLAVFGANTLNTAANALNAPGAPPAAVIPPEILENARIGLLHRLGAAFLPFSKAASWYQLNTVEPITTFTRLLSYSFHFDNTQTPTYVQRPYRDSLEASYQTVGGKGAAVEELLAEYHRLFHEYPTWGELVEYIPKGDGVSRIGSHVDRKSRMQPGELVQAVIDENLPPDKFNDRYLTPSRHAENLLYAESLDNIIEKLTAIISNKNLALTTSERLAILKAEMLHLIKECANELGLVGHEDHPRVAERVNERLLPHLHATHPEILPATLSPITLAAAGTAAIVAAAGVETTPADAAPSDTPAALPAAPKAIEHTPTETVANVLGTAPAVEPVPVVIAKQQNRR
ncbi:MAG: hypothetical protein SFX19_02415 [Alphaproteobacteria bacterium]|nr:hypothetical protein [Alphaproteobacteria bacterium]